MRHSRPSRALLALWARLRQQVLYYVMHFIEGDHSWGQMRSTVALVVVLLFIFVSRLFEPITALPLLDRFLSPTGLREALPPPALGLVEFFASFFTRQTLRHALPPILGVALALYYGAAYLRDLLELPNMQLAFKYLTATLFGGDYPIISIAEGQAVAANPETNPMLKIGGPGWVDIKIGNAALFERVVGPSSVLGAGTHFIRRFETLREAFDLREIERVKSDVPAMTRDGIPLVLPEIRARFRIRAREIRSETNPYPVMTGAIRRAVYSRKVTIMGVENWADMVMGSVRGTITGWIARKRMDELIPPPKDGDQPGATPPPYRQALHDLFRERGTRQRLAEMGADVVWVSVGHMRPDPNVDPDLQPDADPTGHDKIHRQLIETWKSAQAALAHDEISDAQGYARWMEEMARAQAQADLILSVTAGLREARDEGLPLADVIANRLIEHMTGMKIGGSDYDRLQTSLLLQSMQQLMETQRKGSTETPLLPES